MKTGLRYARNPNVLFLDADLVNLTHVDISNLARPVIENRVDLTLSMRNRLTIYNYYYHAIGTDLLTGERCGRKELFEKGYTLGRTGYCIEILFNEFILSSKISFLIVPINAYVLPKSIKRGLIKGNIANLKMCFEIMNAARPWIFLKQSVLMPNIPEDTERPAMERIYEKRRINW